MAPEMQVYHFFPENLKLFKTLFLRTSYWVEDYFYNKEKNLMKRVVQSKKGFKSILSFSVLSLF